MKLPQISRRTVLLTLVLVAVIAAEPFLVKAILSEQAVRFAQGSSSKTPDVSANERFADVEYVATTIDRRPIYSHDGKTYVWAKGKRNTMDTVWFEMTDSILNPEELKHGIGKDTIASIDKPVFLKPDDSALDTWVHPRRTQLGPVPISNETSVIGVEIDGEARAYPVMYLDRHELVNDVFGEAYVTVAW